MRLPRSLVPLIIAWAAVVSSSSLSAQALDGYRHRSWMAETGAPAPVRAISQSPDGYLWLIAAGSVFRFDGVTFEKMPGLRDPELGEAEPRVLHASPSGAIWIGYRPGGVALYRDGALHDLRKPGSPDAVTGITDDGSGGVWVTTSDSRRALAHYSFGKWHDVGEAQGVPVGDVRQILVARDGTTWLVQGGNLLYSLPRSGRFEKAAASIAVGAAIAQAPNGKIWLSDTLGVRPLPDYVHGAKDRAVPASSLAGGRLFRLVFDHGGNLWQTDQLNGVSRIPAERLDHPGGPYTSETFGTKNGLSSDKAAIALVDREDNVWVGTDNGLDRLKIARVRLQQGVNNGSGTFGGESDAQGFAYILDGDGIVTVGAAGLPRRIANIQGNISAPCRMNDGTVMVATPGSFHRLSPNGLRTSKGPDDTPYACVQDQANRLWALKLNGITWLDGTGWHQVVLPRDAPSPDGLAVAGSGVAFAKMGFRNLLRLDPTKPSLISATALGVGGIASIFGERQGLLVSGSRGLARLRGKTVQVISGDRYPWLNRLRGLLQTRRGDTWMMSSAGIIRVATSDLDLAFNHAEAGLPHDVFDAADGLPGRIQKLGILGSQAIEGGDQAVRFLTTGGVVVIDPNKIGRSRVAPPVVVSSVTSGGSKYLDPKSITLRPGNPSIEIAYSALNLSFPERIHFLYKLEGVDNDWVDAGSRREATYGNLAPGEYRFQVIAANEGVVWNRTGAALLIKVPPTFVQSIWFKLLCAMALAALLWWLYTIRVRQVTTRLRASMGVRLAERERIARELHDTLLQTFQGLVLQFQAAANRLPKGRPSRDALDRALLSADAALVEGRNRVRELRVEGANGDLTRGWVALAAELGAQQPVQFELTVEGRPRPLHPLVQEEMQRLGEEALRNAFQHANASAIKVAVGYRSSQLLLDIRDNGVGLPTEVASKGQRSGHYGLVGMRERARRIGGTMSIVSREGEGTEVLVSVPGKAAYVKSGRRWWIPAIFERKRDAV